MTGWRMACIWSSVALLPMSVLLLAHGSLLGLLYAASAAAAFAYHLYDEQRFSRVDHALAWAAIGANFWLAANTRDWQATLVGAGCVLLALKCYSKAKADPARYCEHHTYWHLFCGLAGVLLAQGYVA